MGSASWRSDMNASMHEPVTHVDPNPGQQVMTRRCAYVIVDAAVVCTTISGPSSSPGDQETNQQRTILLAEEIHRHYCSGYVLECFRRFAVKGQ